MNLAGKKRNTGKLVRQCWASSLNNCEGKLSGEHVISDGITDSSFNLYYTLPSKKKIKSDSVKIRFLCQKHNSELSDYDAEGQKLVWAMRHLVYGEYNKNLEVEFKDGFKLIRINGGRLERWFAKTLINLSCYKAMMDSFKYPVQATNGLKLIDYLFRGKPIDSQYGLYLIKNGTNLVNTNQPLTFQVTDSEFKYFYSKTGMCVPHSLPGMLYVKLFGCEFIGNFNVTHLQDAERDNIVVGENFANFSPLKLAEIRPEFLGFSVPHLGDKEPDESTGPPRRIIIDW